MPMYIQRPIRDLDHYRPGSIQPLPWFGDRRRPGLGTGRSV